MGKLRQQFGKYCFHQVGRGKHGRKVYANKEVVERSFRKVIISVAIGGSEDGGIAIRGLECYLVNELIHTRRTSSI